MSGGAAARAGRKRCFLAALPDAASRAALLQSRDVIERAIAGGVRSVRWLAPEALHLTLRFLGASDPAQVECLGQALPALQCAVPPVSARRFGIWPNRARPRMLVLELPSEPALTTLAADCEARARAAGFPPEYRTFRAHVTLARLGPGCAFGIVPCARGTFAFDRIALMESRLGGAAASYMALASVALGAG